MPTTVTKTVKSSGGDYTSLSAWEAAQQGNLVSLDEIHRAQCYGFQDTTQCMIAGSTTDATRYMEVVPAAGAEAQMPYDTTVAYRLSCAVSGDSQSLALDDAYTRVDRIQIKATSSDQYDGSWYRALRLNNGGNIRVTRCAIVGDYSSWSGSTTTSRCMGIDCFGSTGGHIIANNFIVGFSFANDGAQNGLRATYNTPNSLVYNNTFINCGSAAGAGSSGAVQDDYGVTIYKNNITYGNAASQWTTGGSFHSSSDYNASNDATAPGTHSRQSQTFTFAGAGNYHLASGDAGAKGYGTDLSADSAYPFSVDFDNDTRAAPWDIGADQYVSAGGGANPLPGTGVGTLTGLAPTVQTPRNVLPGVGAASLSGFAPTVQTPRNVLAGVGAGTFAGFAPSVTVSSGVVPGVGAATFAGLAPTIQTPRNVQPGIGSLAATGFAPLAGHTGVASPGAGAAIFAGFAPTIQTPRNVTPGVGSATLAGFAPLAGHSGLALPEAAAALFTGFAPLVTGVAFGSAGPHPLRITFDSLTKSIEFDALTKRIAFDPLTKTLDWEA